MSVNRAGAVAKHVVALVDEGVLVEAVSGEAEEKEEETARLTRNLGNVVTKTTMMIRQRVGGGGAEVPPRDGTPDQTRATKPVSGQPATPRPIPNATLGAVGGDEESF